MFLISNGSAHETEVNVHIFLFFIFGCDFNFQRVEYSCSGQFLYNMQAVTDFALSFKLPHISFESAKQPTIGKGFTINYYI